MALLGSRVVVLLCYAGLCGTQASDIDFEQCTPIEDASRKVSRDPEGCKSPKHPKINIFKMTTCRAENVDWVLISEEKSSCPLLALFLTLFPGPRTYTICQFCPICPMLLSRVWVKSGPGTLAISCQRVVKDSTDGEGFSKWSRAQQVAKGSTGGQSIFWKFGSENDAL